MGPRPGDRKRRDQENTDRGASACRLAWNITATTLFAIQSAGCFGWTPKATIAVVSGLENWPVFPFKELEACRALASDTAQSLRSGKWNARPDYAETLDQYVAYLPVQHEEGNFLLADAEARIIRATFAADVNILPSGLTTPQWDASGTP
jgi:hypothetical protein